MSNLLSAKNNTLSSISARSLPFNSVIKNNQTFIHKYIQNPYPHDLGFKNRHSNLKDFIYTVSETDYLSFTIEVKAQNPCNIYFKREDWSVNFDAISRCAYLVLNFQKRDVFNNFSDVDAQLFEGAKSIFDMLYVNKKVLNFIKYYVSKSELSKKFSAMYNFHLLSHKIQKNVCRICASKELLVKIISIIDGLSESYQFKISETTPEQITIDLLTDAFLIPIYMIGMLIDDRHSQHSVIEHIDVNSLTLINFRDLISNIIGKMLAFKSKSNLIPESSIGKHMITFNPKSLNDVIFAFNVTLNSISSVLLKMAISSVDLVEVISNTKIISRNFPNVSVGKFINYKDLILRIRYNNRDYNYPTFKINILNKEDFTSLIDETALHSLYSTYASFNPVQITIDSPETSVLLDLKKTFFSTLTEDQRLFYSELSNILLHPDHLKLTDSRLALTISHNQDMYKTLSVISRARLTDFYMHQIRVMLTTQLPKFVEYLSQSNSLIYGFNIQNFNVITNFIITYSETVYISKFIEVNLYKPITYII